MATENWYHTKLLHACGNDIELKPVRRGDIATLPYRDDLVSMTSNGDLVLPQERYHNDRTKGVLQIFRWGLSRKLRLLRIHCREGGLLVYDGFPEEKSNLRLKRGMLFVFGPGYYALGGYLK